MARSASSPPGAPDPRSVGGFTVTHRLGEGAPGRTYLGRNRAGEDAAITVIRPELAGDPAFRARLGQDLEAARRVRSPYTAALLGFDAAADPPWLATEYVPAPSVGEAVLRHGPMPDEQVRLLGVGLADALAAIHAAGIVHRDLEPRTVLLGADGPVVTGFGVIPAADATVLAPTGAVVGAPGFVAPERITQARSEPAGDVFALGAVLAFAATGRPPFGTGDPAAVLHRTVHAEPDLAGIPEPLVGLIRTCLDRDPARRPGTGLVSTTLSHHADDRPTTGWLPAPLLPREPQPVAPPPARWRVPALAGAAVLVVAALVAGLTVVLGGLGSGGGTTPSTVAQPTSAPAAPAPTTAAPPTTAADVTTAAGPTGFTSPTGNIGCYVQASSVRCDIAQAGWDAASVPPKPAGCQGAWGDSLELTGTGRTAFVCHSDTVVGAGPALAYGRGLRVGDVTCTSRQTGVECRVGAAGHGFTVSRQSYQLF